MKRVLTLLLTASLLTGLPMTAHAATDASPKADRWHGQCSGWWMGEYLTPAIWAQDPERGQKMVERLVICEFAINAPGQSAYALAIADRESSFYPWSLNGSSGCAGVFQMMQSYWPGRAETYLPRWEYADPSPSVFDPRANIEVAAKMVGPEGNWGPWS